MMNEFKRKNDEIGNLYDRSHPLRFSLAVVGIIAALFVFGMLSRGLQLHWIEIEFRLAFDEIRMTLSVWTFLFAALHIGVLVLVGLAILGVIVVCIDDLWKWTAPKDGSL